MLTHRTLWSVRNLFQVCCSLWQKYSRCCLQHVSETCRHAESLFLFRLWFKAVRKIQNGRSTERFTEAWWENQHTAFFQTAYRVTDCQRPRGLVLHKPPVHSAGWFLLPSPQQTSEIKSSERFSVLWSCTRLIYRWAAANTAFIFIINMFILFHLLTETSTGEQVWFQRQGEGFMERKAAETR